MRDAKKSSKKASAKGKAKNTKQAAKPAAKKPAASAKKGRPKGSIKKDSKANTAPEGKVFRVDQNGSPIRNVDRAMAVEDCAATGNFTTDTVNKMLDNGEVVYSEAFYYATKRDALKKWEKDQSEMAPEPKPEPVKIEAGSIVAHDGRTGEVRDHEGKLRVFFILDGKQKSAALTSKWVPATEDQIIEYKNSMALATAESAVVAEVIAPLTEEEKARLAELESEFDAIKDSFESAPFAMGRILDEIRQDKLYRESEHGNTFGEYAFNRFGITRAYAQNLAQLSGFMDIANEALEVSETLQLSVNSANALVRQTNKLLTKMGVGKVEGMDILRPLVAGTARLITEIAPKNDKGEPELSPRLINTAMEVISETIKTGRVHINGKTYNAEEAAKNGLLNRSVQEETILATAENIQAKSDIITRRFREAVKRQEAPARPVIGDNGTPSYYTKTPPELTANCELHGATKITVIGSGRIQTECECRWLIDAETGNLRCYEVKGKRVKTATAATA